MFVYIGILQIRSKAMAEYKVFHCPHGDDFEGGDECDRCEQYELCMETPNGDVIERSKIDEAIDELRKQIEENHLNVIEHADTEWITKDFIYGAIERFKRNIGE